MEFKINEFLMVKLYDKKPVIYVKDKVVRTCDSLFLEMPVSQITPFEDIKTVDDAIREVGYVDAKKKFIELKISPEEEFWIQCSNLQVNLSLMKSNLRDKGIGKP